ncbi:hypothetical protein MNBD_GAMMA18-1752 [hydrothermal vent metagenome]|uniref:Thioredoxin domain-containing protein n=1 Tax=hydrothermal vent metagenome TaxID=652676 RepID=A0A3B0ZJK1_9ZZZZ
MINRLLFITLLALFSLPLKADLLDDFGAEPVLGTAPTFTLQDLAGEKQPLAQWRGKLIMLNFWATWCGPCRAEMPGMERLWQRYRDEGLVVIAVSVDEGMARRVAKFIEILKLSYPILLDVEGIVSDRYQVSALPHSFLIDGDGKLIASVVGEQEWDSPEAYALIESLLVLNGEGVVKMIQSQEVTR